MKNKAYKIINGYAVVKFLCRVIFYFSFVSTSLAYITIPKNKRKTKKLHEVENYNRYIKVTA